MGSFLDKPITTHHEDKKEGNGLKAGLASLQGWRVDRAVRSPRGTRGARPRGGCPAPRTPRQRAARRALPS